MPVVVEVSEEDLEKQKEGGGLSQNTKKTRANMVKSLKEYISSKVSNVIA